MANLVQKNETTQQGQRQAVDRPPTSGTGFDFERYLGISGWGQVKVGFITVEGRPVGVGIQTKHGTYAVPRNVSSEVGGVNIEAVRRWVGSSLYEGHISKNALYPLLDGQSTAVVRPARPECVTEFPLEKHGLTVMQDWDRSKKEFFLYLEGFPDQRFFTSSRPVVLRDFDNLQGPIRQSLNRLPLPAVGIDLKNIKGLHPRAVLGWVVSNEGLIKEAPRLKGTYWREGKYTSEGGKFGIANTEQGGRFFAEMLVGSFGSTVNPAVTGHHSVATRQSSIKAYLQGVGASRELLKGFSERLEQFKIEGALFVGSTLLSTGAKLGGARPPMLAGSFYSSRPFRLRSWGSTRPSTPSEHAIPLFEGANVIVPFNRVPALRQF